MAAAVRNNVWVAPGQDAQFLHKTTALTADGLRGEDRGQVLCNTRDATPGTSSFHDYTLVGDCIFLFPHSITVFIGASWFDVERLCAADQSTNGLPAFVAASLVLKTGRCVDSVRCLRVLSRTVTEFVTVRADADMNGLNRRRVKRCTRSSRNLRGRDA